MCANKITSAWRSRKPGGAVFVLLTFRHMIRARVVDSGTHYDYPQEQRSHSSDLPWPLSFIVHDAAIQMHGYIRLQRRDRRLAPVRGGAVPSDVQSIRAGVATVLILPQRVQVIASAHRRQRTPGSP